MNPSLRLGFILLDGWLSRSWQNRLSVFPAVGQRLAWVSKAARWTFIAIVASPAVAMPIAFGVGGIKLAEDYWRTILPNNDGSN